MIKVYVAASSKETARFTFVKGLLLGSRYLELAYDWAAVIADVQADGGPTDAELSREDARGYATKDLDMVDTARVFWLLTPETRTAGAWFEAGYALAQIRANRTAARGLGRLIVASGPVESSIFCALSDEEHATDLAAFESIQAWAERCEVAGGRKREEAQAESSGQ